MDIYIQKFKLYITFLYFFISQFKINALKKKQCGIGIVIDNQISGAEYIIQKYTHVLKGFWFVIKVILLSFSASECCHLAVILGTVVTILRPQWEPSCKDTRVGQGWQKRGGEEPESLENINAPQN